MNYTLICLIATIIGLVMMTVGGFAIAGFLLWMSAGFMGWQCGRAYRTLKSVYVLASIHYYFERMHKEGAHCFKKEKNEDK